MYKSSTSNHRRRRTMSMQQTRVSAAPIATKTAIELRGIRKSYGEHTVLDGIDLTIAEGSVFSLLGPNGAGKTTIVKIMTTLTTPDSGEVMIAGHDLAADPDGVRSAIG